MALIQIPGTQVWVNPNYVTSVRPNNLLDGTPRTEVEYEGMAGYRTRTTTAPVAVEDVVRALNQGDLT